MQTNPVLEVLLQSRGKNTKLGSCVYHWNLPPGHTCPGMSDLCGRKCYAKSICKRWFNVGKRWRENLRLANDPKFGEWLAYALVALRRIETKKPTRRRHPDGVLLRLHTGGDLFSPDYVNHWFRALAYVNDGNPDYPVHPWGYTRAWRIPELDSSIFSLAAARLRTPWPRWLWCSTDDSAPGNFPFRNEMRMISPPEICRDDSELMSRWKTTVAKDPRCCPYLSAEFLGKKPKNCQDCKWCWAPWRLEPGMNGSGIICFIPEHK